jgi:hypothetical protein
VSAFLSYCSLASRVLVGHCERLQGLCEPSCRVLVHIPTRVANGPLGHASEGSAQKMWDGENINTLFPVILTLEVGEFPNE